jgi:hypothetical protein
MDMGAQYIARVTDRGASHTIREGWSYDRISEARTGCGIKGSFAVEHLQSGRELPVTCKRPGCKGA